MPAFVRYNVKHWQLPKYRARCPVRVIAVIGAKEVINSTVWLNGHGWLARMSNPIFLCVTAVCLDFSVFILVLNSDAEEKGPRYSVFAGLWSVGQLSCVPCAAKFLDWTRTRKQGIWNENPRVVPCGSQRLDPSVPPRILLKIRDKVDTCDAIRYLTPNSV